MQVLQPSNSPDMFADGHAEFPGTNQQQLQHQLLQFGVCLRQLQKQVGGVFQAFLAAPFRRQHLPAM